MEADDQTATGCASALRSASWILANKPLRVAVTVAAMAIAGCSNQTAGSVGSRAAAPATGTPLAFVDLIGVSGATQIRQVAQLGTLDSARRSSFKPYDPVTRRVFTRWLFKTNNAIFADDSTKQLTTVTTKSGAAFSDVAASDRDYAYIAAMRDARIVVGFPDNTFRPDRPLTREQMFAMKLLLDSGGARLPPDVGRPLPSWKDRASVSPVYVRAIVGGMYGSNADTIGRVYGTTSLICPKKPVTRAEAALALWRIGAHTYGISKDAVAALATYAGPQGIR